MRVSSGLPINTCTHVFSYTYVPTLAHVCVHAHTHRVGAAIISFICLHFGKNWGGSSHHLCALGLQQGCSSRLKKAHPMPRLVLSSSTAWISPYIGLPFCKGYYNQQTSKFPARWTSVQSVLQAHCGAFQTSCVKGTSQLATPLPCLLPPPIHSSLCPASLPLSSLSACSCVTHQFQLSPWLMFPSTRR